MCTIQYVSYVVVSLMLLLPRIYQQYNIIIILLLLTLSRDDKPFVN